MQSQEEFDNNISQMQIIQRQIQEENVKMTAQIRELYESCRENRIAATETRTGASEQERDRYPSSRGRSRNRDRSEGERVKILLGW